MLPGSSLDASTPSKQLTSRFADIRLDIGLDPDLDPDLDRDISLIGSGEPAPTRRSELCWPTTSCCCACLSTSHSAPSSAAPPILQVSFSLLFTHVGVLLREGKGRLAPRSSLFAPPLPQDCCSRLGSCVPCFPARCSLASEPLLLPHPPARPPIPPLYGPPGRLPPAPLPVIFCLSSPSLSFPSGHGAAVA